MDRDTDYPELAVRPHPILRHVNPSCQSTTGVCTSLAMVNTGRPSKGCASCKERRVKVRSDTSALLTWPKTNTPGLPYLMQCDEQKPFCGRCIRLKITCAGYADPWALTHRQQDARVAEMVRKRVQKAQQRRAGAPAAPPLARTLHVSPEISSLPKFIDDYSSRSGIFFLECLEDRYPSGPASYLSDAIHATALASISRQQCQAGLMVCARRSYGKAVTGIRSIIHQGALVADDSVLVAMFVLGMFQVPGSTVV